jgi:hypothetical protein
LLFISQKLDEIGRMIGDWLRSLPDSLKKFARRAAGEKNKGTRAKGKSKKA